MSSTIKKYNLEEKTGRHLTKNHTTTNLKVIHPWQITALTLVNDNRSEGREMLGRSTGNSSTADPGG